MKKTFVKTKCYVVVNLRRQREETWGVWKKTHNRVKAQPCVVVNLRENEESSLKRRDSFEENVKKRMYTVLKDAEIYNHSGDDGKEDPPVPIPNTEVKLFYAESTCG